MSIKYFYFLACGSLLIYLRDFCENDVFFLHITIQKCITLLIILHATAQYEKLILEQFN